MGVEAESYEVRESAETPNHGSQSRRSTCTEEPWRSTCTEEPSSNRRGPWACPAHDCTATRQAQNLRTKQRRLVCVRGSETLPPPWFRLALLDSNTRSSSRSTTASSAQSLGACSLRSFVHPFPVVPRCVQRFSCEKQEWVAGARGDLVSIVPCETSTQG